MKLRCYVEEFMLSVRRSRAKGLDILVDVVWRKRKNHEVENRVKEICEEKILCLVDKEYTWKT